MTAAAATAEVFWTAFRALPKAERRAVIEKLLADRRFREDLVDAATVEQRRREPARSLKEYLAARARRARG
jgi:hypothetical protein